MPCIITGDFNSSERVLEPENGIIIAGVHTSLAWDPKINCPESKIAGADHIIMNEQYVETLVKPTLSLKEKNNIVPQLVGLGPR